MPTESPVPALTDPTVQPTAELIAAALGPAGPAWAELMTTVTGPEFRLTPEWHYYRDQSMWLAKVLRGTRNAAWLSAWLGMGRMTCYFAARHREPLLTLGISARLRTQIAAQAMVGRMLPVPVDIRAVPDVADAAAVLRLKLAH